MSEMQFSDSIKENVSLLMKEIGELSQGRRVELVAVSKFQPVERMIDAYNAGIRHFGENRGQEVRDKEQFFLGHPDAKLSFIGVLQKNKVKYLAQRCNLIQSVSSMELASFIDMHYGRSGRTADVLIEINSSGEKSKSGFSPESALSAADSISLMKNVRLKGIMTIGPLSGGEEAAGRAFEMTQKLFTEMAGRHEECRILSMGMSDDYRIALKYGSNMIRIGRRIFSAKE